MVFETEKYSIACVANQKPTFADSNRQYQQTRRRSNWYDRIHECLRFSLDITVSENRFAVDKFRS